LVAGFQVYYGSLQPYREQSCRWYVRLLFSQFEQKQIWWFEKNSREMVPVLFAVWIKRQHDHIRRQFATGSSFVCLAGADNHETTCVYLTELWFQWLSEDWLNAADVANLQSRANCAFKIQKIFILTVLIGGVWRLAQSQHWTPSWAKT
jgi:hypothetical protein